MDASTYECVSITDKGIKNNEKNIYKKKYVSVSL